MWQRAFNRQRQNKGEAAQQLKREATLQRHSKQNALFLMRKLGNLGILNERLKGDLSFEL